MARAARMGHQLLFVGRRAQDPLLLAVERYLQRLGQLADARLHHIRPSSPASEGQRMLAQLDGQAQLVALDLAGAAWSSPQLAQRLGAWRQDGVRQLAWAVGGADGLSAAVLARSCARWSLGAMTLPHRLAQVVVAEQLYRAHTILAQVPYHHGD